MDYSTIFSILKFFAILGTFLVAFGGSGAYYFSKKVAEQEKQIESEFDALRQKEASSLNRLHSMLSDMRLSQKNKNYILVEADKIMIRMNHTYRKYGNQYPESFVNRKANSVNDFENIYNHYNSFWNGTEQLSLSLVVDIHNQMNIVFDTDYSILESNVLLERGETYLKEQVEKVE